MRASWRALPLAFCVLAGACHTGGTSRPFDKPASPTTVVTTTTVPPPTTTTTLPTRVAARVSRSLPRPRPEPVVVSDTGGLPPVMVRIRWCESRNNYTAQNRRSTASGAWQFLDSSWANFAGYPRAYLAPPDVQDQKAMNVYNAVGTRPWNASRSCWS